MANLKVTFNAAVPTRGDQFDGLVWAEDIHAAINHSGKETTIDTAYPNEVIEQLVSNGWVNPAVDDYVISH